MQQLDLSDIQALVLFGHGHLPHAAFVFLRVDDGGAARAKVWLRELSGEVTTARPRKGDKPGQAIQVAFTASGLRAFGLPEETMATFPSELQAGMADEDRARVLGDVYGSAPATWHFGGPESAIDVALLLYAQTPEALEALYARHRRRFVDGGLLEVARQDTALREGGREPFGFRDGIAQPAIEGMRQSQALKEPRVPAGEFILGYANAYGERPFSPAVPAALDPENLLRPVDGQPAQRDLGLNGTYLVIRKLEQDVAGFQDFCVQHGRDPANGLPDPEHARKLGAKLMGRWQSGAPLALCPEKDDPAAGADPRRNNAFDFSNDREGLECPVSSHIRRSNPRDGMLEETPEESLKLVARHRILRRGRPYREQRGQSPREGIMFVAVNANIRRQFEFIQQTWINNPKFNGLYDSRDPVAGANHEEASEEAKESFTAVIPDLPVRKRIVGLSRFVHTRGGGYFFLPGVRALRFLGT